jgi:hypothetical protein
VRLTEVRSLALAELLVTLSSRLVIDQWSSTLSSGAPGGTRRHLTGYVKLKIYILLAVPGHALLWPFPVTD